MNYSGWAKRRGIREARVVTKKEQGGSETALEVQGEDSPLEDKDLIRMEPSPSEEPEDLGFKETPTNAELRNIAENQKQKGASGSGTSVSTMALAVRPGEVLRPCAQPLYLIYL
jgi:hypothetical protein